MKIRFLLSFVLLFANITHGQKINQQRLNELSSEYAKSSFPLLKEILSIPNDAFYPNEIEKNVKWCENQFAKRNFSTTRISTEKAPLLLAERKSKRAKKTVLIYLQIDGQPVDSTRWFQESPYMPTLKKRNSMVIGQKFHGIKLKSMMMIGGFLQDLLQTPKDLLPCFYPL